MRTRRISGGPAVRFIRWFFRGTIPSKGDKQMSQRLHVGATDDPVYDAVVASEADATEERMADWLQAGPWKIRIGDIDLWDKVEPAIAELFPGLFPNDVWAFYMGERSIQHPTAGELREWLDAGRGQA